MTPTDSASRTTSSSRTRRLLLCSALLIITSACTASDVPSNAEAPKVVIQTATPIAAPAAPVSTDRATSLLAQANEAFIAIAKSARASVVNISSSRKLKNENEPSANSPFDDPFFRRFFGDEPDNKKFRQPKERQEQGLGSGVIVSTDGYIVTNNHVVEKADDIKVLLNDKRTFKAKVVGTDPKTDVAVIKIDAKDLPAFVVADSSQLQVGELVLAVGNPFGLNQTVTMGIVSAVGRAHMGIVDYEDFIQTDAAINPGNSGGALVNLRGELVGINTAIFSRSGGNMGIGFAIPSNMARSVMTSLIQHGKVVRGWLGVSIQELTTELAKEFGAADTQGALVADVLDDSPAAKAKLQRGDVIVAYKGVPVRDPGHLRSMVAETPPDTTVTVTILRDKDRKDVKMVIAELPKDIAKAGQTAPDSTKGDHALAGITVEENKDRNGRGHGKGGVIVTEVEPESAAERAGVRAGDVILELNRKAIRSVSDFDKLASQLSPKSTALLLITRGNSTIFLSVAP
ncbi:MAG: DegQ family serine endoprotease [Nitrospiraceae bacterium]